MHLDVLEDIVLTLGHSAVMGPVGFPYTALA